MYCRKSVFEQVMPNHSLSLKLLALFAVSLMLITLGCFFGSTGVNGNITDVDPIILYEIRLPRSIGAYLAGALLGLAGAIAQGLFRNPLADPYLLGSASGALLGVGIILCLSYAGEHSLGTLIGMNGGAFVGALLGVLAALLLAGGYKSSLRLLLSGVVIGVIFSAANALLTFVRPDLYQSLQSFMLGNTSLINWNATVLMALALCFCVPITLLLSPVLSALSLGENTARTLGLPLDLLRLLLIGVLALATGFAVAQTGLIAFVGLAAPHLVRHLSGGRQRTQLLLSTISGGILLLGSDLLAKSIFAPLEIPVGIVTAVLGGGYLLFLLRRGQIGIRK
jgi:iron complex transport system permease protein